MDTKKYVENPTKNIFELKSDIERNPINPDLFKSKIFLCVREKNKKLDSLARFSTIIS